MDQATLVESDIQAGRRLVQALDAAGFPVTAALWLFFAEEGVWRLVIASPRVAEMGPRAAYTEIQGVIRSAGIDLPLPQVTAVPPDDPLVLALRISGGTEGAPFVGGTHLHRSAVGDVFL